MKKFQISIIALLFIAATTFVVSCEKENFVSSPVSNTFEKDSEDPDAFTETEEASPDIQVDEIYDIEAGVTATFTAPGGTIATAQNGDASCAQTGFKYTGAYIIGTSGTTLSFTVSGMKSIQSVLNTNTKTSGSVADSVKLVVSDYTAGSDTNNFTVKLATASTKFRNGSAKITISYTDAKGVAGKTKSVTVKCIGKISDGYAFGTQMWGLLQTGTAALVIEAEGTGITVSGTRTDKNVASNYTPAVGDVLTYGNASGSGKIKGVVTLAEMKSDTVTKGGIWYPKKYKIGVLQWNVVSCKGSRSTKNVTLYVDEFTTKLFSKDGTTAATKFAR